MASSNVFSGGVARCTMTFWPTHRAVGRSVQRVRVVWDTLGMDVGGGHPSEPVHRGVFFDGVSMCSDREPDVVLRRVLVEGQERFALLTPIAFWDTDYESAHVVPADIENFHSDLTSVPFFFTWLVPRTGTHLLAALLHDGLVGGDQCRPTYIGPRVSREEADLIFRRALCSLGVSRARSWLMWTAVTLGTIHAELASRSLRARVRWGTMAATLMAVIVFGVISTLDLFDLVEVVPWMRDRSWQIELLTGALAATTIPAALSVLWGRLWRAGMIAGIACAWLLHVSTLVLALAAGFWAVERVGCACSNRTGFDRISQE